VYSITMILVQIGWSGADWIDLAQDRDKWRAVMNAVMNLRVPYSSGNFRVCAQLVGPRVVLSSIQLVAYHFVLNGNR
jgi:hypothetical protein